MISSCDSGVKEGLVSTVAESAGVSNGAFGDLSRKSEVTTFTEFRAPRVLNLP